MRSSPAGPGNRASTHRPTARHPGGMALKTVHRYAGISHKAGMSDEHPGLTPSYYPTDSWLRINAYNVYGALLENLGRATDPNATDKQIREHRAYGEAGVLVERIVSGVLGDQIRLVVADAEQPPAAEPDLPDPPDPLAEDEDDQLRLAVHALQTAQNNAERLAAARTWAENVSRYQYAQRFATWLENWQKVAQVQAAMYESESTCTVPLGDGVLGVRADGNRYRVDVHHPSNYHPVIRKGSRGYPDIVDLIWAWEEDNADGDTVTRVRRIRYRIGEIGYSADWVPLLLPDGSSDVLEDDKWNAQTERWERAYSYHQPAPAPSGELADAIAALDALDTNNPEGPAEPEERLSSRTCFYSDGLWTMGGDSEWSGAYDDMDGPESGPVVWEARDLDLGYDELPIIHIPNYPAELDHFGRSSLYRAVQLLDDLGESDTDMVKAAAIAILPLLKASGAAANTKIVLKAGKVLDVPEGGQLDQLSVTDNLEPGAKYQADLLERLSVNTQVSAPTIGRVGGQVTSGLQLKLSFAPFEALVRVLRFTREQKYRLLARTAMRLAQQNEDLPAGPTPEVRVVFGEAAPVDVTGLVTDLVALVGAGIMADSTAVATLRSQTSFPITDTVAELARIASSDAEGDAKRAEAAKNIADALGSEQAAANFLGVEIPKDDEDDAAALDQPTADPFADLLS